MARILLIVSGGIAAYKTPELVRRARDRGFGVRCVLTGHACNFVAPLALASVSGDRVFSELMSLTDEHEIGHIRLARECDIVLVAPATANIMAKMAHGVADDLATTVLLATDKPVAIAPAMNPFMWSHPATQRNLETLANDGVHLIGPRAGDMACGEEGVGRMMEPSDILDAIEARLNQDAAAKPLLGQRALVTSGPTHEPIDPVRYIANRSTGKQGHAIAEALRDLGAQVHLVTGPVALTDPEGMDVIHVETALQMLAACQAIENLDIAVCAAAVADWRPAALKNEKIKKDGSTPKPFELTENPDILKTLSHISANRPKLVVGFAAETGDLGAKAEAKRQRKGCDWLVANDVAAGDGVFGSDDNHVLFLGDGQSERWPLMRKRDVAAKLAGRIAEFIAKGAD